jgi:hypothetical protein
MSVKTLDNLADTAFVLDVVFNFFKSFENSRGIVEFILWGEGGGGGEMSDGLVELYL